MPRVALIAMLAFAAPVMAQGTALSPIAGAAGRCQATPARSAVPGEAANRTVTLRLDGDHERTIVVATNARGGVASFSSTVTTGSPRRTIESAGATFDANGHLSAGRHSAGERQAQPLDKDEAAAALTLAKRVLERCAR